MSGNLFHIYHEHSQIPILVTKPVNSDDSLIPEAEINAFVGTVIRSLPVSDMKLTEIIEAQEDDEVCKRVKQYWLEGWQENTHTCRRGEILLERKRRAYSSGSKPDYERDENIDSIELAVRSLG